MIFSLGYGWKKHVAKRVRYSTINTAIGITAVHGLMESSRFIKGTES